MSGPIAQRIDVLYRGAEPIPVKRALANVTAGQTDTQVVALVASRKIRVVALVALAAGTATDLTFGSASTAISPVFPNGVRTPLVLPFNPTGWFETAVGEALTVTTGAGSTAAILVDYVEA